MRSDEALYEALLGGDLGAFDALHERYERPLFGFIRKHLGRDGDAEDVLHDTFLALLRDKAGARGAHSLRAWLFQVARNLCLNRHRSSRRESRALEKEARLPVEPAPHPERKLQEAQTVHALRAAVARLPLELGELYQLRASGLSYQELATVLAVPLGTVKSRLHQMVSRLREELHP